MLYEVITQRDDERGRHAERRRDAMLEQREHQIADRVAAGDECAERTDERRKEWPDRADVDRHPIGHRDRHSYNFV